MLPYQLKFLINMGMFSYVIINFFNSIMICIKTKKDCLSDYFFIFLLFHLSYGFSTILGFLNLNLYSIFYIFRKKV